jgi:hypothetical protein
MMNRAFSARNGFFGDGPRALPWAGMNDAFGVVVRRDEADGGRRTAKVSTTPCNSRRETTQPTQATQPKKCAKQYLTPGPDPY